LQFSVVCQGNLFRPHLRALYVGEQQQVSCPKCTGLTTTNATSLGQSDASNASSLASAAGFPSEATIFLDVEPPSTAVSTALADYVSAWSTYVRKNTPYKPGIYTGVCAATKLESHLGDNFTDYFWLADYDSHACSSGVQTSYCTNNFDNTSGCAMLDQTYTPLIAWSYVGNCSNTYTLSNGTTETISEDYITAVSTGSGGSSPG